MEAPSAPHPIPKRDLLRHPSGPFKTRTFGSKFSSRISQSANDNPDVTEARSAHLPCTSQILNPGLVFSTRKPRISSSSHLAHTTATSAIDPLVIHIFSPFNT